MSKTCKLVRERPEIQILYDLLEESDEDSSDEDEDVPLKRGQKRRFNTGFFTFSCPSQRIRFPQILNQFMPGYNITSTSTSTSLQSPSSSSSSIINPIKYNNINNNNNNNKINKNTALLSYNKCSHRINGHVLLISHDYIYNLGHYIQDIMNWWLAAHIANIPTKQLTVLNIDGLRPGTIMYGKGRFLQHKSIPDVLGPFQNILKTTTTATTVTATPSATVHLYPMPLRGFLWDKFEVTDRCSLENK
eukprot:gene12607-26542_t